MTFYKQQVYYEPIEPELSGSHPKTKITITYKGFDIESVPPFHLYRVAPREGYDLVRRLEGQFTKLDGIKTAIDNYFLDATEATVDSAYVAQPVTKQKVGRPKKSRAVPVPTVPDEPNEAAV